MDEGVEIAKLFGGKKEEQLNVMITTLIECGKDFAKRDNKLPHDNSLYNWMEKRPKTSMVIEIINKLNELGYEIKKIES
jgi:hypothetical protein